MMSTPYPVEEVTIAFDAVSESSYKGMGRKSAVKLRRFRCPTGPHAGDILLEIKQMAQNPAQFKDARAASIAVTWMATNFMTLGTPYPSPVVLNPPAELRHYDLGTSLLWMSVISSSIGQPDEVRLLAVSFAKIPTLQDARNCATRHNSGSSAFF